jgi:hypothetical protein
MDDSLAQKAKGIEGRELVSLSRNSGVTSPP